MATLAARRLVLSVDGRALGYERLGEVLLIHRGAAGYKAYRVQITRKGLAFKLLQLAPESPEAQALGRVADRAPAGIALTSDGACLLHLDERAAS